MAAHTKIDLYQMQSLPLDAKIRMTARRIDAFIDRNDAYLSINDVLEYLFKYELDYAECYGKIIPKLDKEQIEGQITIYEATNDYRGCQFCTTGCKRTGCIFCLFGILQDKDRIIKLEKEDKRLADYVLNGGEYDNEGMWIPTNKGLGYVVFTWENKRDTMVA